MTGSDFNFVAEISPPAEPGLVTLESRSWDNNPGVDIEMAPRILQASFTGLIRDIKHYRPEIYTVLEDKKIAGVVRDIEMTQKGEPRLYPTLPL